MLKLVKLESSNEINLDAESPVIIGRGPLLECNDLNVSRNHGRLWLNTNGSVYLTALHTNPCFVMKNGVPPIITLEKNEEAILNDGDCIGLLPDAFWYRVVTKTMSNNNFISDKYHLKSEEEFGYYTPSNKFMAQVKNINTKNCLDSTNATFPFDTTNKETSKLESKQTDKVTVSHAGNNKLEKNNMIKPPLSHDDKLKALEHTKKLSLKLYEIDNFSIEIQKANDDERSLSDRCPSKEVETNHQDNMGNTKADEVLSVNLIDHPSENQSNERISVSDSKDLETINDNETLKEMFSQNILEKQKENKDNIIDSFSAGSSSSQCRPICQYEEKCYRKNEDHKKMFSHPGDADFIPYENRPLCPYGSSCYRKNKTHLVEYQHPKKKPKASRNELTGSPKPKKRKKQTSYLSSSEEDDYDLEDPFINDGSSDDFVPSESDLDEDD